jgi:hypothetical protein
VQTVDNEDRQAVREHHDHVLHPRQPSLAAVSAFVAKSDESTRTQGGETAGRD